MKDFKQVGVTVSRPRIDQEEIIQAVPLTARKGVQIPQLVTPLIDPNFVPSTQSSKVGLFETWLVPRTALLRRWCALGSIEVVSWPL